MSRTKHAHYFKDVTHLTEIDVYRVCELFRVDDPSGATQHALKKLLLPGQRGAGKDRRKDLQEAAETILRRIEMMDEDEASASAKRVTERVNVDFGEPEAIFAPSVGSDFIPWAGGTCPVPPEVRIDYRLRNGYVMDDFPAGNVCWQHATPPDQMSGEEVVAYRVRPKPFSRIDIVGLNGNDGEHYAELAEIALQAGGDSATLPSSEPGA